ncbi:MAG: hypothetical protein LBL19_07280 [Spirochaetaceae bacterium]|nr:hypothetical protein [Spirochaetaceae bacterium]
MTSDLFGAPRSFTDLFPGLNNEKKSQVFSPAGYSEFNFASTGLQLVPRSRPGAAAIAAPILSRRPSFFIENLLVCPYPPGYSGLITLYNALGKVKSLGGRIHRDQTEKEGPAFKETTRIESAEKNTPLPDPGPALQIPATETIYMRLKDEDFGNTYYRAELTATEDALFYTLVNLKTIYAVIFPLIKEDKLIAQLYIEPLSEGILIYSIIGAEVSDIVLSKTDVLSGVLSRRVEIIIDWIIDGIK